MATLDHSRQTSLTALVTTTRVLLILLFTLVEVVALVIWIDILQGEPLVSGAAFVGFGILSLGLAIGHLLADFTINGLDLSAPAWTIIGFSISEAAIWGIWLAIASGATTVHGFVLATVVLALLLIPQHTMEDSAFRGDPPFRSLLDPGTAGFSVIKAAGATVWMMLVLSPRIVADLLASVGLGSLDPAVVGFGVLALALFTGHNIEISYALTR
ncbi:hypothetical protein BRC91_01705 [Halobacteriales archaeon QS_4_62_28]|nr:MAG: hypothetical protein BRC91_01705 [Halobacteriales archaeon QS_4_62_28]